MIVAFVSRWLFRNCGSGRGEEPSGEEVLRLIQIRLATSSLKKSHPLVKDNPRLKIPSRDANPRQLCGFTGAGLPITVASKRIRPGSSSHLINFSA